MDLVILNDIKLINKQKFSQFISTKSLIKFFSENISNKFSQIENLKKRILNFRKFQFCNKC